MFRRFAALTVCLALLGLAACGGGGPAGGPGSVGSVGSVQVGDPSCQSHPGAGGTQMSASEYAFSGDVWCLTNDARAQHGLPPLVWDDQAAQAAYDHSIYQQGQGRIGHVGPNNNDAGQRLSAAGVSWSTWGENVAVNALTPTAVVNGWLNSSGHYANIMYTGFTHLGCGTRFGAGGPYQGPWYTQKFYAP